MEKKFATTRQHTYLKKQLYFLKYLELGLAITHVDQMETAVKSAYTESVYIANSASVFLMYPELWEAL